MMPKAQIRKIKIGTWASSKLKSSASKHTIKTDNSSAVQWLGISAFIARARFDLWWGNQQKKNQPKKKEKQTKHNKTKKIKNPQNVRKDLQIMYLIKI